MLRWDLQYHPGIRAEERRVKQKKIGVIDPEPRCWNSKSSMALTVLFFIDFNYFNYFFFPYMLSLFDSQGYSNIEKANFRVIVRRCTPFQVFS